MARWLWYGFIYSFLGYCLEKVYAFATSSPHQVRKCFLLLPLCPVYGLAMAACLALIPAGSSFTLSVIAGGFLCTAVEYLVHWYYDRVFSVSFWDYSALRGNLRGRICPQFALIWGFLSALTIRWIHPPIAAFVEMIPPPVTFIAWMLLITDCVLTWPLLRRYQDTELLTISAVMAHIQ